ncbi:MAG TPA: RNA polymerase sigma factor SigJ [Trebonia sp.]|nr:RNA polymerase sigma factor SigJ [Trebonia sp.]
MTDSAAGPGPAAVFEEQRGRLFGLAYRLLGSVSDAEDILQDTFLRWDAADRDAIRNPAAWLTRVVTNLCLTELTSARQRRERYTGTWLPEPVLTGAGGGGADAGTAGLGPLETVAQRESVSMALLLLCEQLSPPERAVFILHEAFGYAYREIGELLDRSEAACRQLGHRAAGRLRAEPRPARFTPPDPAEAARWRQLTSEFLAAAVAGDLAGLERVLADDVVSFSDGGGEVPAALHPVHGRAKVARVFAAFGPALRPGTELSPALAKALNGVLEKGLSVSQAEVNGAPAMLLWAGDDLFGLFIPVVDGRKIVALYGITAPAKLAAAARQARLSGSRSRNAGLPGR